MLDVRLARLQLPLPLETAIGRALMQRERSAQHEGLVLAWELATRILAGSLWSACRHAGVSSPALEKITSKLDRPSLGHWVELARTCATLLRETNHPAAAAFKTTLDGLEQPLPAECGLRALANRVALLDGAPPRPRRVQEALDQLPHYRNSAQSTHKDVGTAFREESLAALLESLIDFCERVPLLGAFSLMLVGRLERTARGGSAELARLHGAFLSWSTRELPETTWKTLLTSRPYLFQEPDLAVPLFPIAAAAASGGEWHVGWYARAVHVPTVAYQGAGGHEFQLALAPDELASLAGGTPREGESASLAAALRLEPFRGLLAYDEEHASIFFGREEETEAALARIEQRGALFVYGASGSGKSSWLRAGIVPALRARAVLAGRRFLPIVLFPGDHPLASLRRALTLARGGTPEAAAGWARAVDDALPEDAAKANERGLAHLLRGLAADGAQPVLVIDQLEEAAMLALDRAESVAFLGLLAGAARAAKDVGAIVLASTRADLLAPLLEHESVRRTLQEDGWPIGSIPPERLARVITEPLRGRKTPIEPGLSETILADVANEPGALALLSQVLTTLWSERGRFGGALSKQGYVDAGRVSGALEKQAEAALAEARAAAPGVEKRVDQLFRALAQSDEGERFTRRRVALSALASELASTPEALRALAQPFVTRRLVVLAGEAGKETVEVSHERLLDAWPRLRNLLANEREVLELRREVEHAATAWESGGRRSELWSDATSKLRRAEELLAAERLDLATREREFLQASRRSARLRKRIERAALATLLVLTIAAGGEAWYATAESARADGEAKKSALAATAAEASAKEAREQESKAKAQETIAREQEQVASQKTKDVLSLSAIQDLQELVDDADRLWPAHPENLAQYEAWLVKARELVGGRAEDKARGIKSKPSLAEHEAKLRELEARATPQSEEQRAAERASHPKFAELGEKRARSQWMARMLGKENWPSVAEVEAELARGAALPTDATGLNDKARPLVDPDKEVFGDEVKALVLARRAVAAAKEGERHLSRDTLAWALYRNGKFDEALTEERTALAEAPEKEKAAYDGYVKKLESAVKRWRDPDGKLRAARTEEWTKLAAEVVALEPEVNRRHMWDFANGEDRWWHATLSKLVSDLKAFTDEKTGGLFTSGTSEKHGWGIVKRAEFARTIEERSVSGTEARRRWDEAIASISKSSKYGGLVLTPQLGLLPIGEDPASHLWEFAELTTGDEPERGAEGVVKRDARGRLLVKEATGLVFVLIPGNTFWMGAQQTDPTGQNYDPRALGNESPVHSVTLTAYFL
ncbi:MAG: AAA family ATPase [Planctomycetes bacterium]|nr:AAA family ATPase [Planctomycetota bacterium]